jgi:MFS superfamily sulfate permease-like transporter
VLVPEALAYASIAGVSPVVGLYAAPAALILYAAFGSSRHLVVGPMSATAALSAAAVATLATPGTNAFVQLTATLALATGVAALIAGLLRLGFLASFISEPVLKGFIIGLALTIIAGQLPALFGVPKGSGDFFEKMWDLLGDLDETSGATLAIGLVSLVLVLGLKRFAPVVPASLVAVAFGVAVVKILDPGGVAIVGHIDSGLPSLGLPDVAAHRYLDLAASALGIMLIGFAEGLGAAKTYAARDHYEINVNRELIGLGAANLGAGLSSGMVVSGSLSKTAVNGSAGARSQLSGLVVTALTIVTLLFLTGLFEDLPEATLAAIVIAAVIELIDVPALVRLYRFHTRGAGRVYSVAARPDFVAALAALLGVLVFDTLPGLFIGIAVSLLLLLYGPRDRTSPSSAAPPATANGATSSGTPRTPPNPASSCSDPRAASSSPTPTRSATPSERRSPTARAQSSSTPRRCRRSTSPPSTCSSRPPATSGATASSLSSPATSAPSATSSRRAAERTSRRTRPYAPPSPRSATSSARPRTPREVLRVWRVEATTGLVWAA